MKLNFLRPMMIQKEVKEKVKVEGKKRPEVQDVEHHYNMDDVKYTKYLISFK